MQPFKTRPSGFAIRQNIERKEYKIESVITKNTTELW